MRTIALVLVLAAPLLIVAQPAQASHCGLNPVWTEYSPNQKWRRDFTVKAKFTNPDAACQISTWDWWFQGSWVPSIHHCGPCGTYTWLNSNTVEFSWTLQLDQDGLYTFGLTFDACHGSICEYGAVTWDIMVNPSCGEQQATVPSRVPTGVTDNSRPLIRAVFRDDNVDCGFQSYEMRLNGNPVAATFDWDPTTNGWAVSHVPTTNLAQGTHTVSASVTEFCCNMYGQTVTTTTSWSFTVDPCGSAPLVASAFSPNGFTEDAQPLIRVTFTDNDHPCSLNLAHISLDGVSLETSWTRSGGTYVLTAVPPGPLLPGSHSVFAAVEEQGAVRNYGSISWTFQVADTENGYQYQAYVPGIDGVLTSNESMTVPGTCVSNIICTNDFHIPTPTRLSVAYALAVTEVHVGLGAKTRTYGPYPLTIPTPWGPYPVEVCPSGCTYPGPATTGTNAKGLFTLTVEVNGERFAQTVPIDFVPPKDLN